MAGVREGRPSRWFDVLVGVLATALAVAVAELLAAVGQWWGALSANASPVAALGDAFIDRTPGWLKDWAISRFGTHDKDALLVGMAVVVFGLAAGIGLLSRRHFGRAIGLAVALVLVVLVAVWSRTGAGPFDGVPTLVGSLAGVYLLTHRPPAVAPVHRPGNRRQLLRFAVLGAAAAAVSGVLARLIPSMAEVEASRSRITVPTAVDPQPSSAAPSAGPTTKPSPTTPSPTTPSPTTTTEAAPTAPTTVEPFARVPGLTPFITKNADFYRIDTTLSPPLLRAEDWQLRVHGLVQNEFTLDYQQLRARPQVERTLTLSCVSNLVGGHLIGNAVWIGARLDALLAQAGPMLTADCVLSTSIDGFTCSTPLSALTDGRDALLAVAMNGEPLPIEHGFPVRMVVPGLYGYASATKWVVDLEVTRFADVSAYWTSRGYAEQGPVKTASRIDVPLPYAAIAAGDRVTIAGTAWAQRRGISAVQIQIDDKPWQDTDLSDPLSLDTWRMWSCSWTAVAGRHSVQCRAIDGRGRVQDAAVRGPLPDGATGYAALNLLVT